MTDTEAPAPNPGAPTLRDVLERIRTHRGPHRPVVVFDLDATLFDNRPRSLAILHDLAAQLDPHDALAQAIARLRMDHLRYFVSHSLANVGYTDADGVARASAHWADGFFRDEYIRHDVLYPGALEYARGCFEGGANLVYLTGRDLPNMLLGTVERLRESGVPYAVPGTQVVLKPDTRMSDEVFKRQAIPAIARVGEVVAFFDNEPVNCNLAAELVPEATTVWLDTQCVPEPPPLAPGVHRATDFRV